MREKSTQERLVGDRSEGGRRPEDDHLIRRSDAMLLASGGRDELGVTLAVHARCDDDRRRAVEVDDLACGENLVALGILERVEHSNFPCSGWLLKPHGRS